MKEVSSIRPNRIGWLEADLDETEMDYLWKCVEDAKKANNDWKKKLVGVISNSLKLEDRDSWFFRKVLVKLMQQYAHCFTDLGELDQMLPGPRHPIIMDSFWVNFQNQTEYNPGHVHKGLYSFVIWMKIPTKFKEQKKLPWISTVRKGTENTVSNFRFEIQTITGKVDTYTYQMSPEMEGKLLLFPADLRHEVFPFYNSNEERVTISGNLSLDTSIILDS